MSRYNGPEYGRAPRDRSRSPSRFSADRRQPSAGGGPFDSRPAGPHRGGSDAPRGRPFGGPGNAPRTLREAPPLGSGDRGRSFRDRDYERRPSPPLSSHPPPRPRSPPPRNPREARDFPPPRDLDTARARRGSRDGPLSAGSTFSDNPPFPPVPRGGYHGRGRGRGDFEYRPGRGGRRPLPDDRDRDLYHRDRSPPPRFGRDLSRDGRDADRRDDRPRFDRRDDDRRSEWSDRDSERIRREQPPVPNRLETRASNDSLAVSSATFQSPTAPPINPERLAIIESTTTIENPVRRLSTVQPPTPAREVRRESTLETPAHLVGRAETTANRYGARASSPPTQAAPPVPAFGFVMPTSTPAAPAPPPQASKPPPEVTPQIIEDEKSTAVEAEPAPIEDKPAPPPDAPSAPKAERIQDNDQGHPSSSRLHGVRSLENLSGPPLAPRAEAPPSISEVGSMPTSPAASRQNLPHLNKSVSPNQAHVSRFPDFNAPTGPKATRALSVQGSAISPRPPHMSPSFEHNLSQSANLASAAHSPPPSAPLGPRRQSFSVSPKVSHSSIPTAPKGPRNGPPIAPRAVVERGPPPPTRPTMPAFAPPSGPRNLQWNQWRRPPPQVPPGFNGPSGTEKLGPGIPAKRDANGDEKERQPHQNYQQSQGQMQPSYVEDRGRSTENSVEITGKIESPVESKNLMNVDAMEVEDAIPRRRSTGPADTHSAAQSFFGKTVDKTDEEVDTSSEEDELDEEEDATLLEAKHARAERELRSQKADLSESRYRATTPLECIARLARISVKDLERLGEREQEMDVEDRGILKDKPVPTTTDSASSDEAPGVLTPRGDDAVAVPDSNLDDVKPTIRRMRRPTPEIIELPFMLKSEEVVPMHELDVFQDNLRTFEEDNADLMAELEDELNAEDEAEEDSEKAFRRMYRRWQEECAELDRIQEEKERLERQISLEPGPESDPAVTPAPLDPIIEGRRLHKFSSEYEIQQVLKQSEETARIEQERQEREAMKVQADMLKEAMIPDQTPLELYTRTTLIDANRLRDPDDLVAVFCYEPPADTFTEDEQNIFIAAFKDTPKKWGEIASLLPGRTYKDCIHHYYANKWDGRFRDNRAKKLKGGGRRGRGGKTRVSRGSALMADLNRNGATDDAANPTSESATGRPRRAAAPTTFTDKELEAKLALGGPSPHKKNGQGSKDAANGEPGAEKATKKRRTGEKPGRKKAQPQLANLAAAPTLPQPLSKPTTGPSVPIKDDPVARAAAAAAAAQSLEDANLLASLHGGPKSFMPQLDNQQPIFHAERYTALVAAAEEPDRSKAASSMGSGGTKSIATSYWSVPEQADFKKYIAHFGTDFLAISTHMGTKTHTMIKNHYQRQIDGGGQTDLERLANEANARRERGEDIGAPPTPTPIIKRKYDNPTGAAQERTPRSIAPQANDAMDLDETSPASHPAAPKHTSPPQFSNNGKPRFATPAQGTPIQTHRNVGSPHSIVAMPVGGPTPTSHGHQRAFQPPPPLGPMHAMRQEIKPESRSGSQSTQPSTGFRPSKPEAVSVAPQQAMQHGVPSVAGHRSMPDPADPNFLRQLAKEQEKGLEAMRMSGDFHPGHAKEPLQGLGQSQHHSSLGQPLSRGSPATRLHHSPPGHDRRPLFDDRSAPGSPPRTAHHGAPKVASSWMSQPLGAPFGASLAPPDVRAGMSQPSMKIESGRTGSGSSTGPIHASSSQGSTGPSAPPAAPGPPKRSNLLSILNNEPEPEPRLTVMRDAAPPAPTRPASPATSLYSGNYGSRPTEPVRHEFNSAPAAAGHSHRPSFVRQNATNAAPSLGGKHEPLTGSSSTIPPLSANAPHERDSRLQYMHRTALSNLGQPSRANPSPPPYGHSRTPSLTTGPSVPPPRDHRSLLGQSGPGQPVTTHATPAPVHAGLYGVQHQQPAYPPPSAQDIERGRELGRVGHAHNPSLDGPPSRDRYYPQDTRPDEAFRGRMQPSDIRERDAYAVQYRQEIPPREPLLGPADIERRRQQDIEHQRQQDQQRHQEQQQRQLEQRQLEQRHHEQHRHHDHRHHDQRHHEQQRQHEQQRAQQEQLERQRQEHQRQTAYSRGPLHQSLHAPSPFQSTAFSAPSNAGPGRISDFRAEAMRESQMAMQDAERRMHRQREDEEQRRRHQQAMHQDGPPPPQQYGREPQPPLDYGRRREEQPQPPMYGRSTPSSYPGQGYQPPPQQAPPPQGQIPPGPGQGSRR